MIIFINDLQDPLLRFVNDDPIRPTIPAEFRVSSNRFVSILQTDDINAVLCVNLLDQIPTDVTDLGDCDVFKVAVFYSIWSYRAGSAAQLLTGTVAKIQQEHPTVERFVTLSPKTEMARRFHLKNGAVVLQENPNSINYEYRF